MPIARVASWRCRRPASRGRGDGPTAAQKKALFLSRSAATRHALFFFVKKALFFVTVGDSTRGSKKGFFVTATRHAPCRDTRGPAARPLRPGNGPERGRAEGRLKRGTVDTSCRGRVRAARHAPIAPRGRERHDAGFRRCAPGRSAPRHEAGSHAGRSLPPCF